MIVLLGIGFVAGVVTAISPCVLPVLPVLLAGGASGRKPLRIVAGLVVSFSVFALFASWLLRQLGLPQDLLRNLAIALLFVMAGVLLLPRAALLLERSLSFFSRLRPANAGGGFFLGATLGLAFVPCARPFLAAITTAAARENFGGATTSPTPGPVRRGAGDGAWINSRPLTVSPTRGEVVLIDFWTYSCINCLRTLPHLKAWDATYRSKGLVIIGVHTPEFAFEHVTSNVRSALQGLGIRYPVVQDDRYKTWDNYANQYWPAEYLIDRTGHVRHTHFGEGEDPQTEPRIRPLLAVSGT